VKEVAAMKWIREIFPRGKEAAFASGLLFLYAAALFLSPDPEWTMWAAQMAIGVLYVPDAPTLERIAPGETVRVMSAAGSFGIFVAAALLALGIKTSCKPRPATRSLPSERPGAAL
jgi:NADPH:quinone reductase-like Zn-dependent oxidoreductase